MPHTGKGQKGDKQDNPERRVLKPQRASAACIEDDTQGTTGLPGRGRAAAQVQHPAESPEVSKRSFNDDADDDDEQR